ncbi:EpsG family protein [Flavobacterium psychrophilum]|uniref:EpsG family protein n=1 Tax=Flavobacterium psychrophilum TaxID=96345 RepID=UPI003B43424E
MYLIAFCYLLFCVVNYDLRNLRFFKNFNYIMVSLLLLAIVTFRYRVGGDALTYEDTYPDMPVKFNEMVDYYSSANYRGLQPFWLLLVSLCKQVTDSIVFFQFVHGFIFVSSITYFFHQYSKYKFTLLLILCTSLLFFYYGYEIQRETLAIAVFLFNIKNLEEKKWAKYYFLCVISFLFHISGLILFFLPLFNFIKLNKKLVYIMLILSLALLVLKSYIFDVVKIFLFSESMQTKGDIYAQGSFSTIGFLAFYTVRVFLFLPIGIIFAKNKSNLKYKWFYSSFLFLSIIAQYFVGFDRFLNYLYPIYFVLLVDFMYSIELRNTMKKKIVLTLAFLHIFFIIDYKLFLVNKYGQRYASLFFPYNSIETPYKNEERELYYDSIWE